MVLHWHALAGTSLQPALWATAGKNRFRPTFVGNRICIPSILHRPTMHQRSFLKSSCFPLALGILAGYLLVTAPVSAQHHVSHSPDRLSVHGMVLFGTQTLYASHLPLFHPPHHYQVLLEVYLDSAGKKRWQRERLTHPGTELYTIAPERFVLPDMLSHPRPFRAALYRGHFERGGVLLGDSLTVNIRRVLYQEALLPAAPAQSTRAYLLLGEGDDQFLIHRIAGRPNFDQIVQVRAAPSTVTADSLVTIDVPRARGIPFPKTTKTVLRTNASGRPLSIRLLRQVYLEFEDLR